MVTGSLNAKGSSMTEQQYREWVGKRVMWEHEGNVLVGIAVSYDADDNELFLNVDGLMHAHIWAPAWQCRIERPEPTTDEPTCTCGHIMHDHDLSETGECQVAIPWCPCMKATDQPAPHPPTREQIADRKRINRLVERVGRDLDRDVYHATGQESDVRDLRLIVLALIQNGAER